MRFERHPFVLEAAIARSECDGQCIIPIGLLKKSGLLDGIDRLSGLMGGPPCQTDGLIHIQRVQVAGAWTMESATERGDYLGSFVCRPLLSRRRFSIR